MVYEREGKTVWMVSFTIAPTAATATTWATSSHHIDIQPSIVLLTAFITTVGAIIIVTANFLSTESRKAGRTTHLDLRVFQPPLQPQLQRHCADCLDLSGYVKAAWVLMLWLLTFALLAPSWQNSHLLVEKVRSSFQRSSCRTSTARGRGVRLVETPGYKYQVTARNKIRTIPAKQENDYGS